MVCGVVCDHRRENLMQWNTTIEGRTVVSVECAWLLCQVLVDCHHMGRAGVVVGGVMVGGVVCGQLLWWP
jgi:hypothetical protein